MASPSCNNKSATRPVRRVEVVSSKPYTCPTCGKQYQRNTHLRRHEATHSTQHKLRCAGCQKDFTRRDVYRKHVVYCSRKQDGANSAKKPQLPDLQALPREPSPACVACCLGKALCDRKDPCTRCIARNITCRSHGQSTRQYSTDEHANKTLDDMGQISQLLYNVALRDMPYLSRVMDTTKHNMLDYFRESNNDGATNEEVSTSSHEQRQRSLWNQAPDEADLVWDYLGNYLPSNYAWMFSGDIFVGSEYDSDICTTPRADTGQVPALTDGGFAILRTECSNILEDLHRLHCSLVAVDPSYQKCFDLIKAQSDLCAENLQFFKTRFLRFGHPHMPIVHYPTCGNHETSWVLLLAMVMGGAVRAEATDTAVVVLQYFRLVEEYTFSEVDKAMMASSKMDPPTKAVLQTLQAGIIVISHMISTGDIPTRLRVRAQRLPKLVNAVRHFGLTITRYKPGVGWNDFIYHEMCVRVATTTAVISWQYSIMFRCAPDMTIAEIRCSFPSPRELWNAADSDVYMAQLITLERAATTRPKSASISPSCVRDFVDSLMQEGYNASSLPTTTIPVETLFVVITAISGICVSASLMGTAGALEVTITRAITRWEGLWDQTSKMLDPAVMCKLGMLRHCPESAHLARTLIETAASGSEHPYLESSEHYTLNECQSLVTLAAVRRRQAEQGVL